jgi:FtsZ-binding cell division protein ZapB
VRNSVDKAVGKRGKKMTDNEIIKALKCCANLCKDGCNGCYLVPSESKDAYCMDKLTEDTLELINRKNEEISKKDIEIDILIQKKEDLSDEVSDLRAEVERLQKTSTHIHVDKTAFEECLYNIETAKVDAYKEFAERLKDDCYIPYTSWTNERVVDESDIDNTLKELTEKGGGSDA